MVFLDIHVAVWLFAEVDRIPAEVQILLDEADLFVSPMVRLELSLLFEIGRVRDPADAIIGALSRDLYLRVEETGWVRAAEIAGELSFTRDPFDRSITAHAICLGAALCTRDRKILDHYGEAFWD